MSDFISAFKVGIKAAKDLHKHELEIDEVFSELASTMRHVTGGKLTIVRSTSTASAAAAAVESIIGAAPRARIKSDGGVYLRDVSDAKRSVRVANWIKQPKGFSFSLQFDSREIISRSKIELKNALAELLSSPVVGVAYLSLTNSSKSAGSDSSNSGSTAAKPAMKRATAKPEAKKTAKLAASEPAAKAAAKPAAAKPAAKAAAKPAAAKPAAKAAAKPAAAKPAAKTAAKPAAAKPAAKTAAKPAAAKPATAAAKPAAPVARPAVPAVPNQDSFNGGVNEVTSGAPQGVVNVGVLN
jgi:hypothetical protein